MEPSQYTLEKIAEMKKEGRPKPAEITWGQWNQIKKLSPHHEMICYMLATGLTQTRIHAQLGISKKQVSDIANSIVAKDRISELQYEIFGKNAQKRFLSLTQKAIDTTVQVMDDKNQKGLTRLAAARDVLDRGHGKPKQSVEIRDNTISDLYNRLDELIASVPKKVEKSEDIEDAEYRDITDLNKEEDPRITKELKDELASVDHVLGGLYGGTKEEEREEYDF